MHDYDVPLISANISSSHEVYDESMRGQQNILLLGREHGKIGSHFLHGVVGVGDGTTMVKRGYSLALED